MAVTESVIASDGLGVVASAPLGEARASVIESRTSSLLLLAVEAAFLSGVWGFAIAVWGHQPRWVALIELLAAVVTGLAVASLLGLYDQRVRHSIVVQARPILVVAALASAAALAVSAIHPSGPSWMAAGIGGLLTALALAGVRGCRVEWLRAERASGRLTRPVVVIGTNGEAAEVIDLIVNHPELGLRIHGLVGDEYQALANAVPWLGDVETSVEAVEASGVDDVIITPNGVPSVALNRLVRELLDHKVHVQLSSGFSGVSTRRLRSVPLAHEPFVHVEALRLTRPQVVLKRVVDVVVGGAILLLTLPILGLAALATKLFDGGPVLFRQTRVGLDGQPFLLFKMRTMVTDAEARLSELSEDNQRNGPLFKLGRDPRITPVGRVLRATSIDELPQLWNVVRGEMSLVGPRPALQYEVDQFDADLHARHRMKPGVTGLWQIEARDNPSFYAYRHLDLFYVENWSPVFDLAILLQTVPSVLVRSVRVVSRRGALS